MKKLIAIILSITLLITACSFVVNAAQSEKISSKLQNILNSDGYDTVSVYIFLKDVVNESEIEQIVSENYTWSTEQEHLKYYRAEVKKVITAYIDSFLDEYGSLIEDIIYRGDNSEFIIANVKTENISTVAEIESVSNIDLYEDIEPSNNEEPTTADDTENDWLYLDSFKKLYLGEEGYGAELLFYEELYYSKDNNGDVEWAFIHAQTNMLCPEIVDRVFHGVHVRQANIYVPFEFGYGVYDVKENKFYDLTEVSYYNQTHDTPKYEYAFDLFKTYYKPESTGNQYEDAFVNWTTSKFGEEWMNYYSYTYNELYPHYDGDEPDWMLCRAGYQPKDGANVAAPMITWLRIGGIGGRTVINMNWDNPFATGYGVYDVEANEFYALEDLTDDCFMPKYTGQSADKYEGLVDALAELNIGNMTGDANGDNKVDILDATYVQKAASGKTQIDYIDSFIVDVNGDNVVDILDATAIQRYSVSE